MGVSPLTGLPVVDVALLDLPAVMISVSHFPASARPQAGLSSVAQLYELYISEGMTRFLAAFYGEYPQAEIPATGGCPARPGPFEKTGTMLGNWVWLDSDGDGVQDPGERGVSGVCANLYDAATGGLLQSAATDANGYYGFNVTSGQAFIVEVVRPAGLTFSLQNVGNDDQDSDVDPATGRTPTIPVDADDLSWDAGL